jgi:predicted DNA-binding transcriptional regulator AlpA
MSSKLKAPGIPRAVRWPSPGVLRWCRERIAAAGGQPDDVPDVPFQFLRLAAVKQLTGLSTSTIYRMQAAGEFPRAIPVDRASVRATP